jgi:5-methyltetrahydropteroyltriglutamate--homocysteine methyltransferase
MRVAGELADAGYPGEVGPGVWDIHSPRVPSMDEAVDLLRAGLQGIPMKRLWVNPDSGLKTRGWTETRKCLEHLVAAARRLRMELQP